MQNKTKHLDKGKEALILSPDNDELKMLKFKAGLKEARRLVKKYAKGRDILAEFLQMRKEDDKDLV